MAGVISFADGVFTSADGKSSMKVLRPIDSVAADDGCLILSANGWPVCVSDDVDVLSETIRKYGLAGRYFFSSSMDFASEYGFANNGAARELFKHALFWSDWSDDSE